jgi:hypothetical protein
LAFPKEHTLVPLAKKFWKLLPKNIEIKVLLTETLGAVDKSLTDLANVEHGRSLDIIPVLAGEGVNAKKGDKQRVNTMIGSSIGY